MHSQMVMFDFDGVIADSFWLAYKTAGKVFHDLSEEQYRNAFSGNIYDWQRTTPHRKRENVDYYEEYVKEKHLIYFFEVEHAIRELSQKYSLTIVSSTSNDIIGELLKRELLQDCFIEIMGADVHESKHEKIKMLQRTYAIAPSACLMVTDTVGDIREARMSGVESIAVTWGFQDAASLESEKPFKVVREPTHLVSTIAEYFSL